MEVGRWKYEILIVVMAAMLFSACSTINPASPVPAYAGIEKINLTTNGAQGSSNNAITDAWVFIDGASQGVYEMPVSAPIIGSGEHTITVRAGVIVNGIASTRAEYPFFTSFDTVINLQPGKTFQMNPTITYFKSTAIRTEDFEQTSTFLKAVVLPNADTVIHIIYINANPSLCLEGNCGATLMDASRSQFMFITDTVNMDASNQVYKYLELNYKGDTEFTVGLESFSSNYIYNDDIVVVKPSTTWKKMYVTLNSAADIRTDALFYKVYLRGSLPTGQSSATIYFDNIKVIHNG